MHEGENKQVFDLMKSKKKSNLFTKLIPNII